MIRLVAILVVKLFRGIVLVVRLASRKIDNNNNHNFNFRKKKQHSNNSQIIDQCKPASGKKHNTTIVPVHNNKPKNKKNSVT